MNIQHVRNHSAARAAARPMAPAGPSTFALREAEDGGTALALAVFDAVRRRKIVLLLWSLGWLGLGILFLNVSPPEYVATTQIVLEPRLQLPVGSDPSTGPLPPTLDSAQADSQVLVIASERNLRYVFDTLRLEDDPVFKASGPGLLRRLLNALPFLPKEPVPSPEEAARLARESAFQAFAGRVTVRRLGQSYVIETSFRFPDAARSAQIANSITSAYIRDQVNFRAAADQRGAQFLQGRIAIIQAEKKAAAEGVESGRIPDFQFPDSDARVVSAATTPFGRTPAPVLVLVIAALGGLLTGVGGLALAQTFDRTVRSAAQVEQALGLPCLGVLPRVRRRRGSPLRPWLGAEVPDESYGRAMRDLRTHVLAATGGVGHIAVGVVSCHAREGRTATAANLAYALTGFRRRVVLIDADLHRPALTAAMAPEAETGWDDYLEGGEEDAVLPELPLSPYLSLVPATGAGGQPQADHDLGMRVLASGAARFLHDRDVIIDLPPLSVSADAKAIGPWLTGLVFVAVPGRTGLDDLAQAVASVQSVNCAVLGIVLSGHGARRRRRKPARRPAPSAYLVTDASPAEAANP